MQQICHRAQWYFLSGAMFHIDCPHKRDLVIFFLLLVSKSLLLLLFVRTNAPATCHQSKQHACGHITQERVLKDHNFKQGPVSAGLWTCYGLYCTNCYTVYIVLNK